MRRRNRADCGFFCSTHGDDKNGMHGRNDAPNVHDCRSRILGLIRRDEIDLELAQRLKLL
jgi:hypothetical protein